MRRDAVEVRAPHDHYERDAGVARGEQALLLGRSRDKVFLDGGALGELREVIETLGGGEHFGGLKAHGQLDELIDALPKDVGGVEAGLSFHAELCPCIASAHASIEHLVALGPKVG
jgi:hypothetical protein